MIFIKKMAVKPFGIQLKQPYKTDVHTFKTDYTVDEIIPTLLNQRIIMLTDHNGHMVNLLMVLITLIMVKKATFRQWDLKVTLICIQTWVKEHH